MSKRKEIKTDKTSTNGWSVRQWLRRPTFWAWAAVLLLAAFEAFVANNQAMNGHKLAELESEKSTISTDIDALERQVAESGSLRAIQQKAVDQLGFAPVAENIWYMSWPTPTKEKSVD
jgi:hypothetical protein